MIGPTFAKELFDAGWESHPGFSWGADGSFFGLEKMSQDNRVIFEATLEAHDPLKPATRFVPKSLIVDRLHAAGKLEAAKQALDSDLYKRERWYAADKPCVISDNPEVLGLLTAIGADPLVILGE